MHDTFIVKSPFIEGMALLSVSSVLIFVLDPGSSPSFVVSKGYGKKRKQDGFLGGMMIPKVPASLLRRVFLLFMPEKQKRLRVPHGFLACFCLMKRGTVETF